MNNRKININKHSLTQDILEIKSVNVDQNYHIKIVVINNFRKPKVNFIEEMNERFLVDFKFSINIRYNKLISFKYLTI